MTFLGGGSGRVRGDCGVGGGGYGLVGSVRGVIGNVGGCGGVGGEYGGTCLAHRNLTTHPGMPCFDSIPRSVVFRVLLLEVWEYVLDAVSGPEHE
jgi:hypothetical protein